MAELLDMVGELYVNYAAGKGVIKQNVYEFDSSFLEQQFKYQNQGFIIHKGVQWGDIFSGTVWAQVINNGLIIKWLQSESG